MNRTQNHSRGIPAHQRLIPHWFTGNEKERRGTEMSETLSSQGSQMKTSTKPAPDSFENVGEFLKAVQHTTLYRTPDARLDTLAAGFNGIVDSSGGFLVAPEVANDWLSGVRNGAAIASRCRFFPIQKKSLQLNLIENSNRANGSRFGAAVAAWLNEGAEIPASRLKFRSVVFQLKKLAGLVPVTDELLDDAPAFENFVRTAFNEEFKFALDDAILNGNGTAGPLGILNSSALITVAAEGGQTAGTIVGANVAKMRARLSSASRENAVWLIHPDAEAQLPLMTVNDKAIYAGPFDWAPFGTLLNIPVLPVEQAAPLGSVGDIILADLSMYGIASRELRVEYSGEAADWFIHDTGAFRFIWRVDGAPLVSQPITPFKGANTRSPFVTLAAR